MAIETLEITCERAEGEPRGGFGIAVEDRKSMAWVGYTVGTAKAADLIRKGDKITHVDGKGPLAAKEVCEALAAAPDRAHLTIVRGEPMPRGSRSIVNVLSFCTFAVFVAAMSWTVLDLPPPEEFFAQLQALRAEEPSRDPLRGLDSSIGETRRAGPAIQLGGKQFLLEEDGAATDAGALRAAMRSDKAFMRETRERSPEWAGVISGRPDGSFDEAAFQKKLREQYATYQHAQAVKLNEDGTAADPARYLEYAKRDKKWLKMIKGWPDATVREEVLKGNPEALNRLLLTARRQADGQPEPSAPPMPPPPSTPYDDIGDVKMSMKVLTDEGEEVDLYSVTAADNEEEKYERSLPLHLRCATCQASAHQGALAVAEALRKRYKDDLVGLTALEAMQQLCDNAGKWMHDYGLEPTRTGVNAITGPGVTHRAGDLLSSKRDVMLQTQHSSQLGRQMAEGCKAMLLGAELEEDELAAAVLHAQQAGEEATASERFIELLCEREGQACHGAE